MNISHPTNRPNFSKVETSRLSVWFSYRTPIAFSYPGLGFVARVNDWSTTTGRHLASISDKADRIRGDVFLRALAIAERGGKLTRERLDSMIRGAERDDKAQERARELSRKAQERALRETERAASSIAALGGDSTPSARADAIEGIPASIDGN